jgi:hypothetical protein
MIVVVSEPVIRDLMVAIASSLHTVSSVDGRKQAPKTVTETALRSAAMMSLSIAYGETVVSNNERLVMPDEPELHGILVRARR